MPIAVAQSLIPTAAQAPLDARTVVASLADIANIENPYIGLEIYVTAAGKKYRVKTLTETAVGTRTVYTVGTYEAVPDQSDLSGLSDLSDRIGAVETAIRAKAAAADVTALADRVSSLESALGTFESQARAILGEEES